MKWDSLAERSAFRHNQHVRRRLTLVTLVTLALVTLGCVRVAEAAPNTPTAWTSNTFVSPSGNIHCRYFPAIPALACSTSNTGLTVAVERYGRADHNYANLIRTGGPVLLYGQHWIVGGFRCDSFESGMQCRSSAGHGFFVNRTEYRVW